MDDIRIETLFDHEQKLATQKVFGAATFDMMRDALKTFFDSETRYNVLWDISNGSLKNLTEDDIRSIMQYANSLSGTGRKGTTAFLVADDASYGIARMILSFGSIYKEGAKINIFEDRDEAIKFLTSVIPN